MNPNENNPWSDWYRPKNPFVESSNNNGTDGIRRANPSLFKPAESSMKSVDYRNIRNDLLYIESMKRKSLETCAKDFVMSLKKSAITKPVASVSSIDSTKPSESPAIKQPTSMWDAYVGDDNSLSS